MKLEFDFLCEQMLDKFFCEGIDAGFLRKINASAFVYRNSPRTPEAKQKFKSLSKELIIHILNGNYKNILSKYFPKLVPLANKTSDRDFKVKLDAELRSAAMTAEMYKSLLKDIDDIIYELSRRNNNELAHLLYLRTNYLLGYQ